MPRVVANTAELPARPAGIRRNDRGRHRRRTGRRRADDGWNDRENQFEGPIGIALDHQGRIWVGATNNRVQCFSSEGRFLTGIGDEGIEPGEFLIPHGLAVDSRGYLYVVDASNQRVQKFELR